MLSEAGALAFFLLGAQLSSVNLPGFDWLLGFTGFSLLFTMVAVAGMANAVRHRRAASTMALNASYTRPSQ